MIKVLFDTQVFDWQINGGISRYFVETINRLEESSDVEVLFNVQHSYNTYLQNTKWLRSNPKVKKINFKGKLRLIKKFNEIINRLYSNKILKAKRQDIFHATYYDPYFLKKINGKPYVLTVYDLTNEKFPDGSQLTKTILNWKKQLIEKANHIVSISENTKRDIVEHYHVNPEKITTIYLSGGLESVERVSLPLAIFDKPYLLYVGSRNGYKNFAKFCKEVAPLLQKLDINLYVVGGGDFNDTEADTLKNLNIYDHTKIFAHVSDGNLREFYSKALLFIFPSIYEGFGIPVLEAMKCNCPVLLSNNSSLPEVGGNAAAYFDPFVEGDLTKSLNLLLLNKEALNQMRALGQQQASKFSWDRTAEQHIAVYQKVLARK